MGLEHLSRCVTTGVDRTRREAPVNIRRVEIYQGNRCRVNTTSGG